MTGKTTGKSGLRIAMAQGTLLAVVYTERGLAYRIISARKAEKDEEEDEYYRENTV